MKMTSLRGRKVCDRVLRKGNVWKGQTMLMRWLPGAPLHPAASAGEDAVYVGTLASSKLSKKAVERNRMRRRCREALRIVLKNCPAPCPSRSVQLLLCPRSPSLHAPFPLLLSDIERFLLTLFSRCPTKGPNHGSSNSS
ncbi:ribonuclease P protein component [Candidatus Peregrinibacteria bacterium]|nr:ribonuclease P protein component [Candidatus Peregrinibacteria bacterium]